MRRILALLLCVLLLLPMLPISGVQAAEPDAVEALWTRILAAEDEIIARDQIQSLESRAAAFAAASGEIQALVEQDPDCVPGSLIRNGDHFFWDMDDGTACGYSPRLRAQMRENAVEGADPEALSGVETTSFAVRGGLPGSKDVAVFQPYYGLDSSFTTQYPNEGVSIAQTTGGVNTTYKVNNATIDNIAHAIETCGVVIFDSHGDTDYANGYDYTSRANTSYICLQSGEGFTAADQESVQGPYGSYKHAYYAGAGYNGMKYYCADGTAIANHMDGESPNGLLWMAICLGMATDGLQAPMREKNVEVVYGYSQSVTFAGDFAWEKQFWQKLKAGEEVKDGIAYMKQTVGCPDPYTSSYPAWPIVVSDEDVYPGHGNVDKAQTVNSTWRLFTPRVITAYSNNEEWGTVSVADDKITASPKAQYFLEGAEVVEGEAELSISGNIITVNAEEDCTVRVDFAPKDPVTVRFHVPEGVSCPDVTSFRSDVLTMPTPEGAPTVDPERYYFVGWTSAAVPDDVQTLPDLLTAGTRLTLMETEYDFYALYRFFVSEEGSDGAQFRRVTEAPASWSGDYVITWNGEVALDASGSYINANIGGAKAAINLAEAGCVLEGDALNNVPDTLIYTVEPANDGAYSIKMKAQNYYLSMTTDSDQLYTAASAGVSKAWWNFTWSGGTPMIANAAYPGRRIQYDGAKFRSFGSEKNPLTLFAACQGQTWYTTDPKEHTGCELHSYGDWIVDVQPSCTEDGSRHRVCTVCGHVQTDVLTALGHVWGEPIWDWDSQEDLVFAQFLCNTCGDFHFETAAPTEERVEPTCTEDGQTVMTATVVFNGHSYTDAKDPVVLPAPGHDFGEWTESKAPTCTEKGEERRVCSRCEAFETRETDALGHVPDEPVRENEKAPSCAEAGSYDEVVYCSVCGAELSRETKEGEPATEEHDWGEPIWDWDSQEDLVFAQFLCNVCGDFHFETAAPTEERVEPTCTEDGQTVKTATVEFNGHSYTDTRDPVVLPATGHQPGAPVRENEKAPTCGEAGSYDDVVYCTVCGAELSRETKEGAPATGEHVWGEPIWDWDSQEDLVFAHFICAVCEEDAFFETAPVVTVDAASCTQPGRTVKTASVEFNGRIYTDTKEETTPALGHDFGEWTESKAPTCTEKGEERRVCSRCEAVETRETEAPGHKPGAPVRENEKAPSCTEAGSCDEVVYCTVCQAELSRTGKTVEALGHTPGQPVRENEKAASCTEAGGYDEVVYCTVCGAELSRTGKTVEALGHTPGEAVRENEKAPTCVEAGSYDEVVYCTVCGAELSRETREGAPATGEHVWGEPIWNWDSQEDLVFAQFLCEVCGDYEFRTAAPTVERVEPSCTEDGRTAVTATVVFNGKTYTDARDPVVLPAAGHDWGAPVWTWSEDLSSASAGFVCARCGEAASAKAKVSAKITKPATETAEGVKTFTAKAVFEGKTYTDVRTQAIPKTGHDCPCKQFVDMPAYGTTEHDAIDWAFTHKPYQITAGFDSTHFAPERTVTRAQAMVFLWAAKDRPKFTKENNQFVDVKKTDWYYKAVLWAVEQGITAGTDATHFSPNKTCNRGEIVTFLYAAMGKPKVSVANPYSDVTNQWYKKAALWAWAKGIEKGEKGKFNASTPCTRGSVVTYLYRFLEGKGLLK